MKIISINKLASLSKILKKQGKKMVVVGGCFDVLHLGHVVFLEQAKKMGDILMVLLESDQKVKNLKGDDRPVYTQKERAQVLSALQAVDYVVMLPSIEQPGDYDALMNQIRPDLVVATVKDMVLHHQRSARRVGAKFKLIKKIVKNYSTTEILNHHKKGL